MDDRGYEGITEADLNEIMERIEAIAAETEERTELAEDAVARMVKDERWDELCGKEPETCQGTVMVQRVAVDCPLDGGNCPHQSARAAHHAAQTLSRLGFGPPARHPDIERIPADGSKNMRSIVREYITQLPQAAKDGRGLLLAGTIGAGKTTALAAVAIATHNADATLHQAYIGAQSLWQRLADEDYGMVLAADVLYIDDLGRESLGGYQGQTADGRFDRFIDERWNRGLSTHITTNQAPQALFDAYPRAMSRLNQRGRWAFTKADDQRKGGVNDD